MPATAAPRPAGDPAATLTLADALALPPRPRKPRVPRRRRWAVRLAQRAVAVGLALTMTGLAFALSGPWDVFYLFGLLLAYGAGAWPVAR